MQVTVKVKQSDAWLNAMKKVQTLGGVKGVKIGIVEKATNSETGESIAFYAACNEYGTRENPPRPFMRMTAEQHSQEWARLFRQVTGEKIIRDPKIAERAFTAIGRIAQADMRDMIMSNMPPPNSPAYAEWKRNKPATTKNGKSTTTGKAGGYTGTLVYTGQMLQSINYKLVTNVAELKD